jgi:hypothetical protein
MGIAVKTYADTAVAILTCRYQLSLALMHSLVDRLFLADEQLVGAGG